MAVVRWTPYRDLMTFQTHVNQLFDDFSRRDEGSLAARGDWLPLVDIYENGEKELVIKAEIPDMKREDIQLMVEHNTLTLRGERRLDKEVKEEQYHRLERSYGSFVRSFSLPPTVDSAKVAAEYRDGVLTIRLPLREEARARQIEVSAA
jgi:HSP20 family protein